MKFCADRNFDINKELFQVFNLREENNKIKCELKCPVCDTKKIACDYTTYWNVSNFQAHLKRHIANAVDVDIGIADYSQEHSEAIDHILNE